MGSTFVAIDLETTGLDPYRDAIIEVGAVAYRDGEYVDEWSSLVNPFQEISSFITSLTGITQGMVEEQPSLIELRGTIEHFLGDNILVGHNIGFDLGFLKAQNLGFGSHRLDTLTLASILLPRAGRYSLSALSQALELPSATEGQHHRALADARRTMELFLILQRRALGVDINILNEIIMAGSNMGWPETIFFEDALRSAGKGAFTTRSKSGLRLDKVYSPEKVTGRLFVPADKPEPINTQDIAATLQPGGQFSQSFPEFEYRPQQVDMALAVVDAFNEGQHLLVEAGTGTGKSIGYLLPASYWSNENSRRVVVSTNTINLQDQLLYNDIPAIQRLLPFEVRAAILKGKRNYLCTRLFQQMRHSGPSNADEMALYARILTWLPASETGDIAEITLRTPGERQAWSRLNAENDACTAEKCAMEGCPLQNARRRAELAHILVVNHALLLADVASDNRVLPEYLDLIIDEAHHLESAVTDGLSFQADRRFIDRLLDEVNKSRVGLLANLQRRAGAVLPDEYKSVIDDHVNDLRDSGKRCVDRVGDFFDSLEFFLSQYLNENSQYSQRIRLTSAERAQPDYDRVLMSWDNLDPLLNKLSEGIFKVAGGLADLADSYDIEDSEDLRIALVSLGRVFEETRANIYKMLADPDEGMIYWVEEFRDRLSLHSAPLHIGPLVEEHIFNSKETVVLTSATLRTAAMGYEALPSFEFLRDRLHAGHAYELTVGSPFDYEASTLVFLPTDIPEPNQPGYQRYVEMSIVDLATALGGRTLVLFTSYNQLSTTARSIERSLADKGITVLAQSEGSSRQQLLANFAADRAHAVLLGTRSFWEGVDVPGAALQAVVIVRLPFDVPTDPIFAARSETFESPFFEYSIPETVLRFRQGFGRLIRRQDDEGVVVVLDKRVLTKRYGEAFLQALPECTVLRQRLDRVGELAVRWLSRETK